jgi:hypothetical protein
MLLDGLLDNLAKKYGTPPAWLRQELSDYIEAELAHGTSEERELIYKAISRSCKMAEGYPDVASVRGAVWRWAQDGFGDLERRRPDARTFDPENVLTREKGVVDFEAKAKAEGFASFTEYVMTTVARRAHEA